MRKKKHNADEIKFCQSRLHRQLHRFSDGDTCFLVNVEWEDGRPMRLVVCEHCHQRNVGTLIKEIKVEHNRIPIPA
jgi:hypothetical protein